MHKLAYTAHILDCKCHYENSFSWFILVLGGWFVRVRVSPLSAANRVSDPKISISNPSYLSLTVPWMEVDSEIYYRWH
jgi:hypothetical protein